MRRRLGLVALLFTTSGCGSCFTPKPPPPEEITQGLEDTGSGWMPHLRLRAQTDKTVDKARALVSTYTSAFGPADIRLAFDAYANPRFADDEYRRHLALWLCGDVTEKKGVARGGTLLARNDARAYQPAYEKLFANEMACRATDERSYRLTDGVREAYRKHREGRTGARPDVTWVGGVVGRWTLRDPRWMCAPGAVVPGSRQKNTRCTLAASLLFPRPGACGVLGDVVSCPRVGCVVRSHGSVRGEDGAARFGADGEGHDGHRAA